MEDTIILCVDGDSTALAVLRNLLSKQLGPGNTVEIAANADEALAICQYVCGQGRQLAVVLVNANVPGMRGDALLATLHELSPQTLPILLAKPDEHEAVRSAVNMASLHRAIDPACPDEDKLSAVRSALHVWHARLDSQRKQHELEAAKASLEQQLAERTAELVRRNHELERLAVTDHLTGLGNRQRLDQALGIEMERARRYHTAVSLILLDIDRFKVINDTHGHPVGDLVLQEVAAVIRDNVRAVDSIGRWGGEEFLVVAANTTGRQACELAEKLRSRIAALNLPTIANVSASFGVAQLRTEEGLISLLARTDMALYHAKQNGRNRVHLAA